MTVINCSRDTCIHNVAGWCNLEEIDLDVTCDNFELKNMDIYE